jgi:ribulose-5-phosphate 4-epimerase/fuculose-1-phosphate aldolase
MSTETVLREKLATCTRILSMQQLLGLFGHISVFDPEKERVYLSPGMGVDKTSVEAEHMLTANLDGKVLSGDQRLPIEWPIHTVLHRRRSDALAVAHLHSPYSTLFSISERKFRPVTLQGSIFDCDVPTFTDPRLVKSVAQGEALATDLGDGPVIFMRGHGVVIVAQDVEQLLYSALILEDEARKAVDLASMGAFHCLDHDECHAFGGKAELPGRSQRAWKYFADLEERWDRNPGTGRVPFV